MKDILDTSQDALGSLPTGWVGTLVAGCMVDEPLGASESVLEASDDWPVPTGPGGLLFMDRGRLSRGTIERIVRKYGLSNVLEEDVPKPTHWKTKKKLRREKYYRSERAAKLLRDKWLRTTPDGLWYYYRHLTTKKGFSWDISFDEFQSIMQVEVDGLLLYEYLFNIYRLDKTNKSYTVNSIVIKERYTGTVLYSSTVY